MHLSPEKEVFLTESVQLISLKLRDVETLLLRLEPIHVGKLFCDPTVYATYQRWLSEAVIALNSCNAKLGSLLLLEHSKELLPTFDTSEVSGLVMPPKSVF